MKYLLMSIMLLCAGTAHADVAIAHQTIEYTQGDTTLEGYLAYPDDKSTAAKPGVIVVHEWMGLNDYAKSRADQLAQLGYVAFAVDIYGKGVRPTTPAEAGAQAGKYKSDRALFRARLLAGLEELKKHNVDVSRIAAIGYCFGGTGVLELARSGADIKGVVSFHGGLSAGDVPEEPIKAKILVLHGADDPFVPKAEVEGFEDEMATTKADYKFIAYPGAVHAFTNPNNKGEIPGALYNADADAKSWQEMLTFFKEIELNP